MDDGKQCYKCEKLVSKDLRYTCEHSLCHDCFDQKVIIEQGQEDNPPKYSCSECGKPVENLSKHQGYLSKKRSFYLGKLKEIDSKLEVVSKKLHQEN